MSKNARKNYQKVSEKYGDLQKRDKFELFVEWYTLPYIERVKTGMETQGQFAYRNSLSKDTLTKWKQRPDFKAAVEKRRQDWDSKWFGEIMQGWLRSCLKGNPKSIELWLQYFQGWRKDQIPKERENEVSEDDVKRLIQELPEDRQKKYFIHLANLADEVKQARKEREEK